MKYATFITPDSPRDPKLGAVLEDMLIDLQAAQGWALQARGLPAEPLPRSLFELIQAGQPGWLYARNLLNALDDVVLATAHDVQGARVGWRLPEVTLYPPLPRPM